MYSKTLLYRHLLINTNSLLCPWGNKALRFSLNNSKLSLIWTLSMAPLVSVSTGFNCI